ncbi:MAG: toll/interleukin-1 receptor domain-containing protein [Chloroflexota bacterium]
MYLLTDTAKNVARIIVEYYEKGDLPQKFDILYKYAYEELKRVVFRQFPDMPLKPPESVWQELQKEGLIQYTTMASSKYKGSTYSILITKQLIDAVKNNFDDPHKLSPNNRIFLSYASEDNQVAYELKSVLEEALSDVYVFMAEAPDGIQVGRTWFEEVIRNLEESDSMIILLTQNSIYKRWIWFEIGHFWSKGSMSIYPIHTPSDMEIPSPINEIQSKPVTDKSQFDGILSAIAKDIFGDNATVRVYNHQQLADTVDEYLFDRTTEILTSFMTEEYKESDWIVYQKLDEQKSLPLGATKKHLKSLVENDDELNWEVDTENSTRISFKKIPPEYYFMSG